MITAVAKAWWSRRYLNWVGKVGLRYLPVAEAIQKRTP